MDSDRPSSLLVDLDRRDPQVQRITVAGEIDAFSAAELQSAVVDVLRQRCPLCIEINLRGVIHLDSAGLTALLWCHDEADRAHCRLTLTDPHPRVRAVLRVTGLLGKFGLTAEQAPTRLPRQQSPEREA